MVNERAQARARYASQRCQLSSVGSLFEQTGIDYAVIKGADVREQFYSDPSIRISTDIDILVSEKQKIPAIKRLLDQGFALHARSKSISHECSLVRDGEMIDLHWNVLRPGRLRTPVVEDWLKAHQVHQGIRGLAVEHQLFLMLVHPVMGRYSTTPKASLVRLVELASLLMTAPEAVAPAVNMLRKQGLAAAGWATAQWASWLGVVSAKEVAEALAPGKVKRAYLQNWLLSNRATRWGIGRQSVPVGYTLAAHDSPGDALRVLWSIKQLRQSSSWDLARLAREIRG